MAHTVGLLHRRGADDITVLCVVAAPEGVDPSHDDTAEAAAANAGLAG